MIIIALLKLVYWIPLLFNFTASFGEYDKNILIIHSYHQNFEWTNEINRGIFEEIKPLENEYFVQIEYLDFKRYQNREL